MGSRSIREDQSLVHGVEAGETTAGQDLHSLYRQTVQDRVPQPFGAFRILAVGDDHMAAGAVLGIAHKLGNGSGGVGLTTGLFRHVDRTLGRGFRDNADAQRLEQGAGQRRHPSVIYQIVKMLQREAETGILLAGLKLCAQFLKGQPLFRQLGGLA